MLRYVLFSEIQISAGCIIYYAHVEDACAIKYVHILRVTTETHFINHPQ